MIKILKSGNWALEGVNVVEMIAGTEGNFGSSENCKLVEAGWAEWAKPKAEGVVSVKDDSAVKRTNKAK